MSEHYDHEAAKVKIREINEKSRIERAASTKAFADIFAKNVRKNIAKDESFFYWYDINLANNHFCNFLDYINAPCRLYDLTYKETDFTSFKTEETITTLVGFSGSVDSDGNISVSPVYDTSKIDVLNVDVHGDYDETKTTIFSLLIFKGISSKEFSEKIGLLANQYRYFVEENKRRLKMLASKARLTYFAMVMSFLFVIGTFVATFIEGFKWEHMTKYLVVIPFFAGAFLFRIWALILFKDVDKKNTDPNPSPVLPVVMFVIPLIALAVQLFGVAVGVPVFSIAGMIASAIMLVWNAIEWLFTGVGSSLVYHAKVSDEPRRVYLKQGGKEGYVKRLNELKKYILPKTLQGFETPFFHKDLSKLRKEQSERYYKHGDR